MKFGSMDIHFLFEEDIHFKGVHSSNNIISKTFLLRVCASWNEIIKWTVLRFFTIFVQFAWKVSTDSRHKQCTCICLLSFSSLLWWRLYPKLKPVQQIYIAWLVQSFDFSFIFAIFMAFQTRPFFFLQLMHYSYFEVCLLYILTFDQLEIAQNGKLLTNLWGVEVCQKKIS